MQFKPHIITESKQFSIFQKNVNAEYKLCLIWIIKLVKTMVKMGEKCCMFFLRYFVKKTLLQMEMKSNQLKTLENVLVNIQRMLHF